MAGKQMLAVLAVAAVSMATLPAMARATEYVVGDDRGWGLDVNYTEWAQGKVFVVGDSLGTLLSPLRFSNDHACTFSFVDGRGRHLPHDDLFAACHVNSESLVFYYSPEKHNVLRVKGSDFQACNKVSSQNPLESGNDTIPLSTPGRKWYICGKAKHCEAGQKLAITVLSSDPPTPNAPVPGSSNKIMIPEYQSLMVVTVAALMTFMI